MSLPRPIRPLATVTGLVLATAAVGLLAVGPAPAADRPGPTPATASFLSPATARGTSLAPPAPRSVAGTSSLVTLRTDLLPRLAEGQEIRFDLGQRSVSGRFTHIERNRAYTAWTGSLDVGLGSFVVVRAGAVYRAALIWPGGLWQVTQARGSQYWLTDVSPYSAPAGDDTTTDRRRSPRAAPARSEPARSKRRHIRIDVLFAYTSSGKDAAGGKAGIRAAAGQAAASTNLALASSGIDAKVRVKGVVPVKGHEGNNPIRDLRKLQHPHDGAFDAAIRLRTRHHADIVHLLTGGPSDRLCGAGAIPFTARNANPVQGASTSTVSCLPYLVATHELGHNLGADHIDYPGVSHHSKMPGSYAWYDVAHHFITAVGTFDPCEDAGDFTCVRIPAFSNPTGSYYGFPIGSAAADNTRVIKQIAPIVARYSR